MNRVVEILRAKNRTIRTMESCTGGGVVNKITNVEGASEVLKFSAVTYSNDYKIKMGVSSEVIGKHSVYSMETAIEMSTNISKFAHSDYGIGITGKLNRADKNNISGADNVIFISIYDSLNGRYYNFQLEATRDSRQENKEMIISAIENKLLEII